jgi:hypothetical protein
MEKATRRPLIPSQEFFASFSSTGIHMIKDKSGWPWKFISKPFSAAGKLSRSELLAWRKNRPVPDSALEAPPVFLT